MARKGRSTEEIGRERPQPSARTHEACPFLLVEEVKYALGAIRRTLVEDEAGDGRGPRIDVRRDQPGALDQSIDEGALTGLDLADHHDLERALGRSLHRILEQRAMGLAGKPHDFVLQLALKAAQARTDTQFADFLCVLHSTSSLHGAERISSDTWLLGPGAAAGMEIILPERSATTLEIGVELRRTNGASAAATRAWLATGAPAVARVADFDEAAARQLLTQGNQLLSRGDIVAARTLYERHRARE